MIGVLFSDIQIQDQLQIKSNQMWFCCDAQNSKTCLRYVLSVWAQLQVNKWACRFSTHRIFFHSCVCLVKCSALFDLEFVFANLFSIKWIQFVSKFRRMRSIRKFCFEDMKTWDPSKITIDGFIDTTGYSDFRFIGSRKNRKLQINYSAIFTTLCDDPITHQHQQATPLLRSLVFSFSFCIDVAGVFNWW